MKMPLTLIALLLISVLLAGCGNAAKNNTASVTESVSTESTVNDTSDAGGTTEKSAWDEYCDTIKSMDVRMELQETKQKLDSVTDGDCFNYAFITDLHTDTSQSSGNFDLTKNTIEYLKALGKEGTIDCIVLGGDQVTGWFDKAQCANTYIFLNECLADSPVPVIMVKGNHDNNINVPGEDLSNAELYDISQAVYRNDAYVYDESVENGFYFYTDFAAKKTRLICLDSYKSPDTAAQSKWLAEKAFTVKDEGWKYVLVMHVPIDIRYEAEMTHVCSGADDIKKMIYAINSRGKAECSFGTYDFSDFKSQVVSLSCGHTHCSYMEYNAEIDSVCTVTGCSGAVGEGIFDYVKDDDGQIPGRKSMSNSEKNRYLADIFSVSNSKVDRVRFGNGIDKNVPLQ